MGCQVTMPSMRCGLTLVLVLALACAPLQASASAAGSGGPASAAEVSHDWQTVLTIPSGTRIKVEARNGRSFDGKLKFVSESAVSLSENSKETEILKDDARRVYVVGGRRVGKTALQGAMIVGGALAIVGSVAPSSDPYFGGRRTDIIAGGVVGAMLGAMTGAILGLFRHKRTLVYEIS
jgi:hypothetical protein